MVYAGGFKESPGEKETAQGLLSTQFRFGGVLPISACAERFKLRLWFGRLLPSVFGAPFGVDLDIFLVIFRKLIQREDRLRRANRLAGSAIDALIRMNH